MEFVDDITNSYTDDVDATSGKDGLSDWEKLCSMCTGCSRTTETREAVKRIVNFYAFPPFFTTPLPFATGAGLERQASPAGDE